MKKHLLIYISALLLAVPPLGILITGGSILITTGCATTDNITAKGKIFLTLEDTQAVVHEAMNEYGRQFRAGKVSTEQRNRIISAHMQYRRYFDIALEAAQFDLSNATPDHVKLLATAIMDMVRELK